jgi:hypothetical protein
MLCLVVDVGCSRDEERLLHSSLTSTATHNTYKNCVYVVPSDDGQVMPKTCRGFEPE